MRDYTKALHQRFYQAPEHMEEEREMDQSPLLIKKDTFHLAGITAGFDL